MTTVIDENALVEEKGKLYDTLNSGYDVHTTLKAVEKVLAELEDIDRITRWIIADYAYKGCDLCRAIEEHVRRYQDTCQHHKTHEKMARILMRTFKVSEVYHKANHWRKYENAVKAF